MIIKRALVYGWNGWERSDLKDLDALREASPRGLFATSNGDEPGTYVGWYRHCKEGERWVCEGPFYDRAGGEFDFYYYPDSKDSITG